MKKYNWYALKLVAVCVVIFALEVIYALQYGSFDSDGFNQGLNVLFDSFGVSLQNILIGRVWTLITYLFIHGSFEHLFYNMFALGLFGTMLEILVGSKKFLLTFFAAGVIAGVGSFIYPTASIGASGAIYGVMGVLAAIRPKMVVYVGIPLPMALAAAFWAAGDLLGLFFPDMIGHFAHLTGLAFGLIYGFNLRKEYGETATKKPKEEDISDEELEKWEDEYMT